jgi:hypothetical protein
VTRAARHVLIVLLLVSGASLLAAGPASAQRLAKYGADFLAGGVGARALGMGGAHVALAGDVTSGYWNVSGLAGLTYPEVAYMHAERFAGVVSFDYGSAAFPLNARSTIGLSIIRLGVDDIPNTLNAWDRERNQPRPNAENFITRFSAADYAFFVGYARSFSERFSAGVTGKIVHRSIGPFASAWGYSMDLGARYRMGAFVFGANLQDVTTMLQAWSVNPSAFNSDDVNPDTGNPYTFQEMFAQELPEGGTFLVLPVARLGSGYLLSLGPNQVALGFDVDVAFDGQRAYTFNAGDLSFHPRIGAEFSYRGVVALRAGLGQVSYSDRYGFEAAPSVGAGLDLRQIVLDYGFGDFAGIASDLGFSHRISLQVRLQQERFRRSEN